MLSDLLAEGIALEVTTQEQTTHILMTEEHNAVEVVDLTLQQISYTPDLRNGGDIGQHLTIGLTSAI